MRKLLIFFLLFPSLSYSQTIPDYGYHHVHIIDKDKTTLAEILPVASTFPAKPDRFYYWYASNLIHKTQGGYSGKLLNGAYSEYYPSHNLMTKGSFKNGLKEGDWQEWNDSGMLTNHYHWKDGLQDGKFVIFDNDGKIKEKGKYHNGQLVHHKHLKLTFPRLGIFKKKKK